MISAPNTGAIVPVMSTITERNNSSSTLFGKTRRADLALLFLHVDDDSYLRQLARICRYWYWYWRTPVGIEIAYRRRGHEASCGDHCHIETVEKPYVFTSVETLVADFLSDIENIRGGMQ